MIEFGTRKVWAFDAEGRFGVQAEYRFDSEEGRDLITGVAGQLGPRQRRGWAERTGIIVGIIGAAGALITLVVLLVMWLTGGFAQ